MNTMLRSKNREEKLCCHSRSHRLNVGTNSKFPSGYAPSKYVAFACAVQMLRETLCAGVTSVREMGGLYGQELHQLATSGLYPSPNFHYAGKFIGMTGGHTDEQYLPVTITRNDRDDMYEGVGALCDGVADCVRKTREQLRKRADVIKARLLRLKWPRVSCQPLQLGLGLFP
eukprot:6179030-Pleurochrysis_carterae.AAC.3